MFKNFENKLIHLDDATINLKIGGDGPPLLLLHGYPQTHVHWHAITPLLDSSYTLVLPDLRGYGDSLGPRPDPKHYHYSKRTMALDMILLMEQLGFSQFCIVGHDRGARVAYRLALDHPEKVTHLVSIDTVPTVDIWEAIDKDSCIEAFHWSFLAQPAPLPEKMIGADPSFFLHYLLKQWAGQAKPLTESAIAHYEKHFCKPSVLQAMSEDYRAGATVDMEHDLEDRASGKKITCPVLVPWGNQYTPSSLLPIWQNWAYDVCELSLDCGHFVAEEAPEQLAKALLEFLK